MRIKRPLPCSMNPMSPITVGGSAMPVRRTAAQQAVLPPIEHYDQLAPVRSAVSAKGHRRDGAGVEESGRDTATA
jgi:hypothetical protein